MPVPLPSCDVRRAGPRSGALALVLVTLAVGAAAAHPGHGVMAIVGTLASVETERVTFEVRDPSNGMTRRVVAGIGRDTKVRVGKAPATLSEWIGASIVATVDYEEGPDGQPVYYATKIQIHPKKTKR